jgi:DUF4097 and DUF4098 domain-containing protein YvlB
MRQQLMAALLAWGAVSGIACAGESKILGSIDIASGQHADDLSTVNGSIHVGDDATVGRTNTVNGGIMLEEGATAASAETVNGGIHLSDGARVTGNVQAVNGSLNVENGGDIGGKLANVNGNIRVKAAHVAGPVDTVNGDVEIGPNARLDNGIIVQENLGDVHSEHDPRIVIKPGSVVTGTLRFERKVILYVSDRATVGSIQGATPIKFSGDYPPK